MSSVLNQLQPLLGYIFKDPALAELALSHCSLSAEDVDLPAGGNQRLELLGDAVIGLALAETLYQKLPTAREGALASLRSELSRGEVLTRCARRLGLEDFLRVGGGEAGLNPRRTDAMLEDALEALIGAVFLDGGYAAAATSVQQLLAAEIKTCLQTDFKGTNPKGDLQEIAQASAVGVLPVYRIIAEEGPDHNKCFTAQVTLDKHAATGGGSSRKAAESAAAEALLQKLRNADDRLS